MSWPRFSLRYRYTIFALLIAIVVLGVGARFELPVQLFPDTDPPVVTVITAYPGVSPEDVARNLSKVIEEEIGGIDGIKRVTSTSQVGLSIVKAEFHYTKRLDSATLDVQNMIGRIRDRLPAEIQEPQVLDFSSADKPIVTLAATSPRLSLMAVRQLADNGLKDAFQLIDGVAAVDVFGGHNKQLEVVLSKARMNAYHVTLDQVKQAIGSWNLTASGGRVQSGERELVARFDLNIDGEEQARRIAISSEQGRTVYLEDVATVRLSEKEARSVYHYNGQPAIALQILKRDEANTVEVAGKLKVKLEQIRAQHPELNIAIADDDSDFTNLVVQNMTSTIYTAIGLTIIVVLLFLGNIRQAAIIAISIPVSFFIMFFLMQCFDIGLNMVTMSAIILSIGLLVDDGIVVLENVNRHMLNGATPLNAAVTGTEEILMADLAGTITTISVLVPLMFMGGFVGKLFAPLAWTLFFALVASFLVSVTLIPLLTAMWLRAPEGEGKSRLERLLSPFQWALDRLKELYLKWLRQGLKYPARALSIGAMLLVSGIYLMSILGSEMLPSFDGGSVQVTLDTIPGTPIATTERIVRQAEERFLKEPGVVSVSTMIGYEAGGRYLGSRGAMDGNQSELTVTLTPRTQRDATIWEIMDRVRGDLETIPGISLLVLKEKGGTAQSTTTAPIDIRIAGPDTKVLDRLGAEVFAMLRNIPGTHDVYRSWGIDTPEARVEIDRERANELGLTGASLARTTYESIEGVTIGPLRQASDRDLNIVARYAEADRKALPDFLDVSLANPAGVNFPLRDVAHLQTYLAPRIVTREDFERTLDVLGFGKGRSLSYVIGDVRVALKEIEVPAGYSVAITGEQRDFEEAQSSMGRALLLGILAVYLILVSQFNSFKHPMTIMMAIPLQIIGVALALLLTGKYLSMPALLGLILLTGTVVNNSIVLIDYILFRLREGVELHDALIESVSVRYRPIMMTAMSDIVGMLPLAMEMAVGAERFSPIATVVIGGILAATLLTLVFIPLLFSLFYRPKDISEELKYENALQ